MGLSFKKSLSVILVLIVFGMVFYTGYLFGQRDMYNKYTPNYLAKSANGSVVNSLSNLAIKDIVGSKDSKNVSVVGKFYYTVNSGKTEILVNIESAPDKIYQANSGISKVLPNTLLIKLATRTDDGLSYTFTEIGKITFGETNNSQRSAVFSSVLDFDITQYGAERLVFDPITEDDMNIFINNDENLPFNLRGQISSYFWVIL